MVKKIKNIHNLDSLEREIYRLKLDAKNTETRLNNNTEFFQKHFLSVLINSFAPKKQTRARSAFSFKSILESEKFNVFFDKFTNCATTRAADGLNNFFHRIARQKKLLTINAGSLSTTQVVAFFIHS